MPAPAMVKATLPLPEQSRCRPGASTGRARIRISAPRDSRELSIHRHGWTGCWTAIKLVDRRT
jgi:hypothetical protein